MRVRVKWDYTYMVCDRFEEVVDLPDAEGDEPMDAATAMERAKDAAMLMPNGEFDPVETTYPGDSYDEFISAEVVPDDTSARVRWTENDEPELIERRVKERRGPYDRRPVSRPETPRRLKDRRRS